MDPQQLETLNVFLSQVDKDNLFQYLDLKIEANDDEAEAAIKKRRSWAQGQQSNPKYRTEAIWYIKNISLLKQVLLENRPAYIQHLRTEKHRSSLRTLSVYILGAMAGGVLSTRAEDAIRARGTKLGLPESLVSQQIERLLKDQDAQREDAPPVLKERKAVFKAKPHVPQQPKPHVPQAAPEIPLVSPRSDGGFVDYYAVLGVAPGASTQGLEAAYRSRYRQVGRLDSPSRARQLYAELDEAWHHLRDPLRRTSYDQSRRQSTSSLDDNPSPDPEFDPLTNDPIEDGVTSDAPRLPDGLAQRTYQPGKTARTPKLEIDGPEELKLSIGRSQHQISLTIRNTGRGRMSGRVHADRPWVIPLPARLDPLLKEQVIKLLIDPGEMLKQRGQCRVTISTRTGGNRSVMLQVQRSGRILPFVVGGVTLVGAAVAIIPFLGSLQGDANGTGRLVLNVDPPVGEVYIDDTLINTQGTLDTEAGFPLNTPFVIKIQADGFAEWSQIVSVEKGKTVALSPELELTDPMNFIPKDDWEDGGLDSGALQREIYEHSASLEACFAGATVGSPGYTASIGVEGYINQLGAVARIDFLERNFDAPEIDHCLRRQFRGLSMPLLNPRFDYATFTHVLYYTVPDSPD
ncbi:MAG: hypothetical protein ACI8RZ_005500 [Myxococcota bacterium]|jgi:hypothetical protein